MSEDQIERLQIGLTQLVGEVVTVDAVQQHTVSSADLTVCRMRYRISNGDSESIREFSIVISVIISESYVIFGPLINGLHDGCSQKSQSLQNGFNRWSMGCCGAVGYESGSCESSGSSC